MHTVKKKNAVLVLIIYIPNLTHVQNVLNQLNISSLAYLPDANHITFLLYPILEKLSLQQKRW